MQPKTIAEVREAVREHERVLPRGGGTKPGLSGPPAGVSPLEMAALCGVVEYEPGEFTITALAGTRAAEVDATLRQHGQYLPCDPILAGQGATLGGTVAAGTSGPGSLRYGRLRDFLIGVRFVDGEGSLVRSGGKVVKNAAGFDLSKLMVGSLGLMGVLVELTFKVFPEPPAYATVRVDYPGLAAALAGLHRLAGAQLDLHALDIEPGRAGATLWVRLGGLAEALPGRIARVRALIGGDLAPEAEEAEVWRRAGEMDWAPEGWALAKVPVTPGRIDRFDAAVEGMMVKALSSPSGNFISGNEPPSPAARGLPPTPLPPEEGSRIGIPPLPPEEGWGEGVLRRYSQAGQVAWVAAPPDRLDALDMLLKEQGLSGLAIRGPAGRPRLGLRAGAEFERRVKRALDPAGRFGEA